MGNGFFGGIFFFVYPVIVYVFLSRRMQERFNALERRIAELAFELSLLKKTPVARDIPTVAPTQAPTVMVVPVAPAPTPSAPPPPPAPSFPRPTVAAPPPPEPVDLSEFDDPAPHAPPAWLVAAKNWLFTGNLVAKIGLLILFIGVSFLLKYTAERVTVPIELRLAGIGLASIGLLFWGWHIRDSRRGLALPVQGAALGILMLVTFGSFKLYHLLPAGLAFGMLLVLTAFTCALAVLQNALWLAIFGIAGGFLSPIMTSTGSGSHIGLFTYYAVLNAGILAIAWRRAWRALNLLGFAFTFIIGTAWGVLKYAPDQDYLSTQLFLLLFFGFYVAIAVLYAMRQAPQLKGYVDGTLVFGTPLLAFGLQIGLVKDMQFGNAFSALGFGLFYVALAMALWRRRGSTLKLLVETFLALGIVFATLAIPMALDGRWTSAAWALEGAGITWVGLRQKQRLTWMFGLLVQVGAWLSFIGAISGLDQTAAANSNLWLGFLLLAVATFFMATRFRAEEEAFPRAAGVLLGFAAVWLMAGAWTEILLRTSGTMQANLLALSGLFTAAVLYGIAVRAQWALARSFAVVAQVVAGACLLAIAITSWDWTTPTRNLMDKPVLGALLIAAGAFATSRNIRVHADGGAQPRLGHLLLAWSAFWWFGPILNAASGSLMLATTSAAGYWLAFYTMCASVSALAFLGLAKRMAWPALRWLNAAAWPAAILASLDVLLTLYFDGRVPGAPLWIALVLALAIGEYSMQAWPANGWPIRDGMLKFLHLVRTAGPWFMLWKIGELLILRWWQVPLAQQLLVADGAWRMSGSWSGYLPAWAMMLIVYSLIRDCEKDKWPVVPLGAWYRSTLLPLGTAFMLALVAAWNLRQDGSMAPLPYLPLLNPLDLSTAFALLLGVRCYRMVAGDAALAGRSRAFLDQLPRAAAIAAYLWFNLVLLRTASHVLGIEYRLGPLLNSQFVQAMLSLVWSATAMAMMWMAARRPNRKLWMGGAALLGLVVAKLFLADLSGVGSVARIVSFLGVGVLMVAIGYVAPFPKDEQPGTSPQNA